MRGGLSLRARLGLSAAFVVAMVVGGTTLIESRIVVNAVELEAKDAAAAVALGIAGELSERAAFPAGADLDAMLFDFTRAEPSLRSLTVTRGEPGKEPAVLSTDEAPAGEAVALAARALSERRAVSSAREAAPLHYVAVPLGRDRPAIGTVVVGISLDSAHAVRRQVEVTALAFGAIAIVLLILALDRLAVRLVLRPLGEIREAMVSASGGDLGARVEARPDDEVGAVGRGLNSMLDRLADFNAALRREVESATSDLREANRRLHDTAERLFTARRDLARSEQLAAAGRMAADVAHQVGTPLNLVSGYVQMLLKEQAPESREAERLRTVREQIRKVTAIVQGLLDRARRPILHLQRIAPSALLAGVADLAGPSLAAARVDLRLDVADGLPRLFIDTGQVEQALLNLVTNSRDAMPEGGCLDLRARGRDGFVEIAVSDSGQGIAPEILSRVFDPLFTTKPPGRGTGLGLPIVREVVAAHGGTVDFASGPSGTTVTIRLPAAAEGEGGGVRA